MTHVVPAGHPPRAAVRSGQPPLHGGGASPAHEPESGHCGPAHGPASPYVHCHVATPLAPRTQSASFSGGEEEHGPWFGHFRPGVVHVRPHTVQRSEGQPGMPSGGGASTPPSEGGRVHTTLGHADAVTHCSAHTPDPVGWAQQISPPGHAQLDRQLTAGHADPTTQCGAHAPVESATLQQTSLAWHASAPHACPPPGPSWPAGIATPPQAAARPLPIAKRTQNEGIRRKGRSSGIEPSGFVRAFSAKRRPNPSRKTSGDAS
jgi:hypothetical protein